MAVTAMQRPDFRTISGFRERPLAALAGLFEPVLALCRQAGLVKLGHVALDGTKVRANASRHEAMSYGRMKRRELEVRREVERWLGEAEQADAAEDAEHGGRRGDEMPEWMADERKRLEKIRAAKAALEAEAAEPPREEDAAGAGPSSGMMDKGRPRRAADGGPPDAARRNFTDPDGRIPRTRDGFVQGYNGQIAVDGHRQVITAHRLTTKRADYAALVPPVDDTIRRCGRKPRAVPADAGSCNEDDLAALGARQIAGHLMPGRAPATTGPATPADDVSRRAAGWREWRPRSDGPAGSGRYRLRQQIVEPVSGQIKAARGFRQFLLRGFHNARHERALICTVHDPTELLAGRAA